MEKSVVNKCVIALSEATHNADFLLMEMQYWDPYNVPAEYALLSNKKVPIEATMKALQICHDSRIVQLFASIKNPSETMTIIAIQRCLSKDVNALFREIKIPNEKLSYLAIKKLVSDTEIYIIEKDDLSKPGERERRIMQVLKMMNNQMIHLLFELIVNPSEAMTLLAIKRSDYYSLGELSMLIKTPSVAARWALIERFALSENFDSLSNGTLEDIYIAALEGCAKPLVPYLYSLFLRPTELVTLKAIERCYFAKIPQLVSSVENLTEKIVHEAENRCNSSVIQDLIGIMAAKMRSYL